MKKLMLVLILLFMFLSNSIFADKVFKVRQFIGKGYIMSWFHNDKYWGSEVHYRNDKSYLWLGVGPKYSQKVGPFELKTFGYIAVISDTSKLQWPGKFVEIDSFLIPTISRWILSIRTTVDIDPRPHSSLLFWGENFIGYQFSKDWQIQIRTEWKYSQSNLTQSIGLGWSEIVSSALHFNGYLGIDTERPFSKVGWLEIRARL